jgi:hypothetical protein
MYALADPHCVAAYVSVGPTTSSMQTVSLASMQQMTSQQAILCSTKLLTVSFVAGDWSLPSIYINFFSMAGIDVACRRQYHLHHPRVRKLRHQSSPAYSAANPSPKYVRTLWMPTLEHMNKIKVDKLRLVEYSLLEPSSLCNYFWFRN